MNKNYLDQDLTGQNFDNQDLSYALLRGANLTDCSFVGTDLTGANLRETIIQDADFTGAVMYYSNIKDAVGTADFTDALVFGMPQWIPMPGSIYEDPEVIERQLQIDNLVLQSDILWESYTQTDQNIMNSYISMGYSGQEIRGDYEGMPQGKDVYQSIDRGEYESIAIAWMINEHMKQGTTFDTDLDLFIANPDYREGE